MILFIGTNQSGNELKAGATSWPHGFYNPRLLLIILWVSRAPVSGDSNLRTTTKAARKQGYGDFLLTAARGGDKAT